jgi:aspartate/methionine/tyrosine aminotransferase
MKGHIEHIQINDVSCPATMNQLAVLEAVSGKKSPKAVEEMRLEYLRKRDLITSLVNEVPGLHANVPKGTFYLFTNAKPLCEKLKVNSKELADKIMREAHTLVLHGSGFGPHGEDFIRFSFVGSDENIREGIRRIKEWAEKL